jgi:putative SOS response-associated peptidase YedK
MCGRYAITMPPEAMRRLFAYVDQPNFPPRYNVAPTQPVPVVHRGPDGRRRYTLMRWGFLPGFVKDPKEFPLVINIRSETAREKPSFRAAFRHRRALMPCDGFYEWRRIEDARGKPVSKPYLLRRRDRGPMAFAALHETWHNADGAEIDTVALLNTHANGLIAAIHPRSPVILDPARFDAWLDPKTEPDAAQAMLRPPPDDLLEMIAIGPAINRVANDGPEVQTPLAPDPSPAAPPAKIEPEQGDLF